MNKSKQIRQDYHRWSKILHWTIALIVIPMVFGGFYLEDIPKIYRFSVIGWHKSLGLLVLMLMLFRYSVMATYGRPALPNSVPGWQKFLARSVQYGFYVALLAMPIFGWIMSTAAGYAPYFFGLGPIPFPGIEKNQALSDQMFACHEWTAYVIIGLLVLHLLGAFKHYYLNRDGVVQKMLP